MAEKISKECINLVKLGDLFSLQEIYRNNIDCHNSYVFQRVFNSACSNNQIHILRWLYDLYIEFDTITQLALKPTIIYGKYIIKNKSILDEYKTLFSDILDKKIIKCN